jgi:adenosine deaminase
MVSNWSEILYLALENGDRNMLAQIPHTDLHCHSLTSVPFQVYQKISHSIKRPPKSFKSLNDFNSFLEKSIAPHVKNLDIVRTLVQAAFQRLVNEGVVYTEMSFDLAIPEYINVTMDEYLEMIKTEKEKISDKILICIEVGLDRQINPNLLFKLFQKSLNNNIFGSIDLYGDENANPIEEYIKFFKLARKFGLKLKAHVGEFGTANEVKKAIEKLDLQAIQHGISSIHSKEVIKQLIQKNIPLNICPRSNIVLGIIKSIQNHPIRRLFDEGVIITVNSDDFTIFSTSVNEELLGLYQMKIFSGKEINQIIHNGLNQVQYAK